MEQRYKQIFFFLNGLGCTLFLSFPLLFLVDDNHAVQQIVSSLAYWLFGLSFIVLYYINAYWLIPKLLVKKRYLAYGAVLLLLLLVFSFMKPFDRLMRISTIPRESVYNIKPEMIPDRPPPPNKQHIQMPMPPKHSGRHFDIATIYIFMMVIALSAASRMIQYWIMTEKRVVKIEGDKAKAELSFLKAQVHPHFLFNTLHNIYSLSLANRPETSESIFKLAQLMRYFMEETSSETVPLAHEVACVRDYIGLQRLRLGANCIIEEHYEGLEFVQEIMPLLFMPFVENAFKYGISKTKPSFLYFEVKNKSGEIFFQTKNTMHEGLESLETTRIGIHNTRQRLQHGYPDRHELRIEQEKGFFCVTLILYHK